MVVKKKKVGLTPTDVYELVYGKGKLPVMFDFYDIDEFEVIGVDETDYD